MVLRQNVSNDVYGTFRMKTEQRSTESSFTNEWGEKQSLKKLFLFVFPLSLTTQKSVLERLRLIRL